MLEHNKMNHEQFSVFPRGNGGWGNGVIMFMAMHHLTSDGCESRQPVFIPSSKLPRHSRDHYHIYSDQVPLSPDESQSHLLLTEETVSVTLNDGSMHAKHTHHPHSPGPRNSVHLY